MPESLCANFGEIIECERKTFDCWIEDKLFIFENVPVKVCTDCNSK